MDEAKYGVGIVGAGWVAGEYVKAFRDHPLTKIVGIYNRTPEKARRLLATHGVQARVYPTAEAFFDDPSIHIVVDATSPDMRATYCCWAAETGRHVVIEKPIGLTPEDTERIRAAIAGAGVKSVTSFVLRWNPQFITLRQMIDEGVLGDLIYAEGDYWHPANPNYPGYAWNLTREKARSPFVAAGCHAVDTVRYLGGEIVEVAAYSAGPKINLAFEYDPITVAVVRFANGAVGKLSAIRDADTPYIFNCRLFGTEGTLQNNRVYSSKHYPGALDYWEFPTIKPDSGDVSHHPFNAEIAHFVACIENDVESHASIHDTWKTMAVCYAIDESAAQGGRPVSIQK